MTRGLAIACSLLVCIMACSSSRETEPTGLIARFGSTPTIDGVFAPGEWDDAEIARADTVEQFRVKHDGENLYLAVRAGGGDLVFNTAAGVRVLHWSGQLGSAEYAQSDSRTQSLERPFAHELWGLRDQPPAVIRETLARYLAENGWAANTASMGNLMESELAVSFDWLGVNTGSEPFVELPGIRVSAGLMIARDDPRGEELLALPREELRRRYPNVFWPAESPPSDSIGMGGLPDTIRVDPADYGRIWIDLRR
jgi:hypothetical protein